MEFLKKEREQTKTYSDELLKKEKEKHETEKELLQLKFERGRPVSERNCYDRRRNSASTLARY